MTEDFEAADETKGGSTCKRLLGDTYVEPIVDPDVMWRLDRRGGEFSDMDAHIADP